MAASPSELVGKLADAITAGRLDAALALWEPDAHIVGPDGSAIARGHDAIRAVLAAMIEHGTRFEAEVLDVYEAGDLALVTGNLTLIARDGSVNRSRSLVVHLRGADGQWRIALDAPSGLPAATWADGGVRMDGGGLQQRLREAGAAFIESHDRAEAAIREAASEGTSAQEIAALSGLAPETVRVFLRHLGVSSDDDEAQPARVA